MRGALRSTQALVMGLLVCSGAVAAAQSGAPLVTQVCVADEVALTRDAAEICNHLGARLSALDAFKSAQVDRLMVAEDGFNPVEGISGARELINEGIDALDANRAGRARRQLSRGLETALALEPYLSDRKVLIDALLWNVRADVAARAPAEEIEASALRMLNFAPSLRLAWQSKAKNDEVFEAIERAVRHQQTQKPGRLEVQCDPPNSAVYLNGEFVGVTPLRLGNLPRGEHLVRVRKPGYEPRVDIVNIANTSRVALDVALSPTKNLRVVETITGSLPDELVGETPGKALSDLKAMLLIEQAVVVKVSRGESEGLVLEAFLYDMRSSQLLSSVEVKVERRTFEHRQESVIKIVKALTTLEPIEDDTVVPPPGGGGGEASLLDDMMGQWWFWPGVGVVAAGVLTTVIILSVDDEEPTGEGGIILRF